eukprot:4389832-Alexandrium_andersonii.AAC.1
MTPPESALAEHSTVASHARSLNLRGPRKNLGSVPRSSQEVHSAELLTLIPNSTTKGAARVVPRA